jgi:hypothetical protein
MSLGGVTDPYARAILALVSKGDWNAVIKETTLPLKYRVEAISAQVSSQSVPLSPLEAPAIAMASNL